MIVTMAKLLLLWQNEGHYSKIGVTETQGLLLRQMYWYDDKMTHYVKRIVLQTNLLLPGQKHDYHNSTIICCYDKIIVTMSKQFDTMTKWWSYYNKLVITKTKWLSQ